MTIFEKMAVLVARGEYPYLTDGKSTFKCVSREGTPFEDVHGVEVEDNGCVSHIFTVFSGEEEQVMGKMELHSTGWRELIRKEIERNIGKKYKFPDE